MKKQNLLDKLSAILGGSSRFYYDHLDYMEAMKKVYVRKSNPEYPDVEFKYQIIINPHGSIYKVTTRYFMDGDLSREDIYLATYNNGQLSALGKSRYLILDPILRLLYVEDWDTGADNKIEIYEQQ
jgi:hypothetical protein